MLSANVPLLVDPYMIAKLTVVIGPYIYTVEYLNSYEYHRRIVSVAIHKTNKCWRDNLV